MHTCLWGQMESESYCLLKNLHISGYVMKKKRPCGTCKSCIQFKGNNNADF